MKYSVKSSVQIFFSVISLLAAAFFSSGVSSCSSTKNINVPEYISNSREYFDEGEYLSATGEGSSKKEAQVAAAAELSRYIQTSITANTVVKSLIGEVDGKFYSSENVSTENKAESNFTFSGLEYTDFFESGKKYFVTVYIQRKKAFDQYNSKVEVLKNEFIQLYNQAEKSDPITAVPLYNQAEKYAGNLLNEINVLHSISSSLTDENYSECKNLISSIAAKKTSALKNSALHFNDVQGDCNNIIYNQVTSVFKSLGYSQKNGAASYVVDVKVQLNKGPETDEDDSPKTAMPSAEILITYNGEVVFEFNTVVLEKTIAYSEEKLKRESLKKLAAKIQSELPEIFTSQK